MDPENYRTRRSLRRSVVEGGFSASVVGVGETFFSAFAVVLGASPFQLALLGTLPQLIGAFGQLVAARFVKVLGGIRGLTVMAVLFQAASFLPLLFAAALPIRSAWIVVLAVCGYHLGGITAATLWSAWMGELVPPRVRGVYFGGRNRVVAMSILGGMVFGWLVFHWIDGLLAFALVFLIAFIARLVSAALLSTQYLPPEAGRMTHIGFRKYLKLLRKSSYGRFTILLVSMNFFVFIAAPFFTPYMLTELSFSWLFFVAAIAAPVIAKSMTLPGWGMLIDRYGAQKVLVSSGIFLGFPILWIFANNIFTVVVIQLLAGFAWGGFTTASGVMLMELTKPEERVSVLAHHNTFVGTAIVAGGLTGVAVFKLLAEPYDIVFLVSGVGRVLVVLVLSHIVIRARVNKPIGTFALLVRAMSTAVPSYGVQVGQSAYMSGPVRPSLFLRFWPREYRLQRNAYLRARWRFRQLKK